MVTTRVLLIEDNPADSDGIQFFLRSNEQASFELATVQTLREGMEQISATDFDVVLLDLSLPDASNLDAVLKLTRARSDLPIVVLTGLNDIDSAIASLQHGVQDYLSKDRIDQELLVRSLRYAIERKRIEEESRQAQAALQRAERLASLGTLAAGIAHEINNPIVAAWTSAQAALNLKDDPDAGEALEECLQNIIQSVQRCRDTVENVLRFARQGEVERTSCKLADVLQRAIQETHHYAEIHDNTIDWSGEQELPEVFGNAIQLQQVIVTLLRNAIEASKKDDIINVTSKQNGKAVHITVADHGRGMTDEEKQHAFDPFFTSRKETGTGLGLSIAHGIIEGHGGSIEIESSEGVGTNVTFTLATDGSKCSSDR